MNYNILSNKGMRLIFIHGSGAYGGVWRYQTDYFPDSDAINLPGHLQGQTLSSVEEYADWLRKYIGGKGYQDVVLAGHSFGGAITLMYALKYPQELKGIIIIGSGARLRVHPRYLTSLEEAIKGNLQEWNQLLAGIHHLTPENYKKEVVEQQKAIGPAVMLKDFLCCDKFDLMDRAQEIKLPALIICGELDVMTPVKYANYLGAKLANSRVVVIPQATHFVLAEKPEAVNKAVEDFVKGISS
jgi:pimeloyl-ACP methyl ester carboxylesterase